MIKPSFLKKQLEKSRADGRTSPFLVRFVMMAADRLMAERYGDARATSPIQSSVAVKALLMSFGIGSRVFAGAVCYPELYRDDATVFKWSGFWGAERHFWTVTEFNEFVDLTLASLHAHPGVERADVIPAPALWWSLKEHWPPFLRYLPEGPVRLNLPAPEMRDLEELRAAVASARERMLEELEVATVSYSPVITGPDSVKEMASAGELWAERAGRVAEFGKELPEWIAEREKAIEEEARRLKEAGRR